MDGDVLAAKFLNEVPAHQVQNRAEPAGEHCGAKNSHLAFPLGVNEIFDALGGLGGGNDIRVETEANIKLAVGPVINTAFAFGQYFTIVKADLWRVIFLEEFLLVQTCDVGFRALNNIGQVASRAAFFHYSFKDVGALGAPF